MPAKHLLSELISTMSAGDFDGNATAELDKVVSAVEAGHGTGKLTVTFTVKKEKRMLVIDPRVKATIPVTCVDKSMFFVDAAGKLTDEDPKQLVMKLPQKGAARIVDIGGGRKTPPAEPGAGGDDDTTKKGS